MINRSICFFILACMTSNVCSAEADIVLDVLYREVELKIRNDRSAVASVGYLNGTLKEKGLVQEMMGRTMELVELNAGKDPSLYFLLLEYKDRVHARKLIEKDLKAGRFPKTPDEALMVDFLCSYFEIVRGGECESPSLEGESPFKLDVRIEPGLHNLLDAVVTISNQTDRGRFFLNSGDAMDYLCIERVDGVSIPSVKRWSPIVPIFLDRGEEIVKRCLLQVENKNTYDIRILSKKYPGKFPGMHSPCSFFCGTQIPHMEIHGEIVGFGTNSIPLKVSAQYVEKSLYGRLVANNFDGKKMPWLHWHLRSEALAEQGGKADRIRILGLTPPKHDWYREFLDLKSEAVDFLPIGGGASNTSDPAE